MEVKMNTFGRRLRIIRKHRGLTQKGLGLMAGFSPRSADIRIAQYESGQRQPKKDVIIELAKTLQVNPTTLLASIPGTPADFLQSLFWMEEFVGADILELCFAYWQRRKRRKDIGAITPKEYLEEKLSKHHFSLEQVVNPSTRDTLCQGVPTHGITFTSNESAVANSACPGFGTPDTPHTERQKT